MKTRSVAARDRFRAIFSLIPATQLRVAQGAGINYSYISHILRDGWVPCRDVAYRVADALVFLGAPRVDVDLWLWDCGYVPQCMAVLSDLLRWPMLGMARADRATQCDAVEALRIVIGAPLDTNLSPRMRRRLTSAHRSMRKRLAAYGAAVIVS